MIISASRRTDIPAFHARAFMENVRRGFCDVANPFNPAQISRISLLPEDVDCFVFWTRDPRPLMPFLSELDDRGYFYYFLFTVTGYPRYIEPAAPARNDAVDAFAELSRCIGKEKLIWRYDPVLYADGVDRGWHCDNCTYLFEQLSDYTEKVVFSIIEPYRKVISRMNDCAHIDMYNKSAYLPLLEFLCELSLKHNLKIAACAQGDEINLTQIEKNACIDAELIARITAGSIKYRKDTGQRQECRCAASRDIGRYGTCAFGCRYCYAC